MGSKTRNIANNLNTSLGVDNDTITPATDLQPVKSDISALALREATNESTAAFNLPGQFIETFTDDTNLGTQTDCDRVDGYMATVYSVLTPYRYWQTIKTSTENGGGYHSELEVYSSSTKHTITAGMLSEDDVQAWNATQMVDGNQGTNGFHTDSADVGAYVRIDFGAGNEKSIDKFRYYVTNPASCTWTIQYSSNGSSWTDAATGWVTDDTTGTNQWKEKSFTAPSNSSANPNGTLIQSANAVSGARTKVGGTLLYKDNAGTNNLGTEIKVYFTCDGGLNWTEASSYTAITPVYSTGIKQVRLGETTCTSGQDVRYKIEWESQGSGTKEAQIHGIGINY